ncbi:hypothetical protein [Saccharothrix yanglingensis]|uniref:DUF5666 domain-containing protein n=1 Tax=Saccharothrix yanglingensis TaxID=659496 RepID=A0ABU0WSK6_9PSEU|nr:hypothetical protein [Saccharothrix yanglingensis]MDQ2582823.1 hypothetical protein [Saccharothrix yanglingensis]
MKALKACVAVLAVGSLLVGCGSEWEDDVRFKVARVTPETQVTPGTTTGPRLILEIDQEKPDSVTEISTESVAADQAPEGAAVGDVLVCKVRQWDDNSLDGVGLTTDVGPCRAA